MTTDWIKPPRPERPDVFTYEGVRVVRIEEDVRTNAFVLHLEGGRFRRIPRHELLARGPLPRHLMVDEKDTAPRGLSMPSKRKAPPEDKDAYLARKHAQMSVRADDDAPSGLKMTPRAAPPSGLKMPSRAVEPEAPRGLSLPPTKSKGDLKDHAAPSGLAMPANPNPFPSAQIVGKDGKLRPAVAASPADTDAALANLLGRARNNRPAVNPADMTVLLHRRAAANPVAPGTFVIGGDPRAPKMLARAKEIDLKSAEHPLFHGRLQMFLDMAPGAWATWGEDDAKYVVKAASVQAEQSRQLSLANAVKWATDCEQAYSKPPSFLDRLSAASKPEFYQVRLEQAQDILIKVQAALTLVVDEMKFRSERIRVDALVLQVATEDESDNTRIITSQRRFQTLTAVQATAAMVLQGCEALAQTCASQAASVGDLLHVTIPNWIIAQKAR